MQQLLNDLAVEIADIKHWSYEHAERQYLSGQLGVRRWRIYSLFWVWSCGRVSGPAVIQQHRLRTRRGPAALLRRINQFRQALGLPLHAR